VLAPRPERDPELAAFRRHLEAALALGPRFVVILSDLETTSDGRFAAGGKRFDIGPDAVPVPLFLFPGGGCVKPKSHLAVECVPGGRLVFVKADALKGQKSDGDRRAHEREHRWLMAELRELKRDQALFLLLDRPPWDAPECTRWSNVRRKLARLPGPAVVLTPGAERWSWWRWDEQDYLELGPACPVPAHAEHPGDGRSSGVLWVTLSAAGPALRILDPDGILRAQTFSRIVQRERERLHNSLASTPAHDRGPVSVITCVNPTSQTLDVKAQWTFAREGVTVDPQIMGFELAPGEVFKQEFRFVWDGGVPLKFTMPRLLLSTATRDANGIPVSLALSVSPWCRMVGEIIRLAAPPGLDGRTDEWPRTGRPLNHASQVVQGRRSWRGPNDVSGSFYVGTHGERLYLAATVHDDHVEGPRGDRGDLAAEVHLDLRPEAERRARDNAFPNGQGLVRILIRPDGSHQVIGAPGGESGIRVATRRAETGFGAEISLPLSLAPGLATGAPLYADLAIFDRDPGDEPKALFFSGDLGNTTSSKHFAIFAIP